MITCFNKEYLSTNNEISFLIKHLNFLKTSYFHCEQNLKINNKYFFFLNLICTYRNTIHIEDLMYCEEVVYVIM